ncbi:methionyl-tRNA formyltransferase [Ferrimicrobium acidiphilum]|uniref:methionyl-tRNA formyltransferase n=1 Tax=Ferrimicrobium acidiphilum TaxID=121039 RepID=A0ABV3XZI3_9ACTN
MRIAFFGTGDVSAVYLQTLFDRGLAVVRVVTKQPKRRSRNGGIEPTPVAELAAEHSIPVLTTLSALEPTEFDLGVVVSYGRILPAELVNARPLLNVHYSLLPQLRGAAPVERAILEGSTASGVTLMRLVEEMDAGPVYAHEPVAIEGLNVSVAYDRLTAAGCRLLADWLAREDDWLDSEARPQVGSVSYAPKIEPGDLVIRWHESALQGFRRHLLERAYFWVGERRIRLVRARVDLEDGDLVLGAIDHRGRIQTAKGMLVPELVRPEGRTTMPFLDFLRGAPADRASSRPPGPVSDDR